MLAMAAVLATLEAIENDAMISNARSVEQHLREQLTGIDGVVEITGKGCLLGIRFDAPASEIHRKLLDKKIIAGTSSDPNVLRLLPPLCVTIDEIDQFVEALRS